MLRDQRRDNTDDGLAHLETGMRKHFVVLIVGSVLFLVRLQMLTWEIWVGGSDPAAVAARNSARALEVLGLLGLYAVFAVLVIGHALLPRPSARAEYSGQLDEGK